MPMTLILIYLLLRVMTKKIRLTDTETYGITTSILNQWESRCLRPPGSIREESFTSGSATRLINIRSSIRLYPEESRLLLNLWMICILLTSRNVSDCLC